MRLGKEISDLLEKPLLYFFAYHEFEHQEMKNKQKSKQFLSNKSI